MNFFGDKDLDEKSKLIRRKSMLNLRYAACAYLAYLGYKLITTPDESPEIPFILKILVPLAFIAAAVVITIITYNDKKRLDERIEKLNAIEISENESLVDNTLSDEDHEDDADNSDEEEDEENCESDDEE